MSKGVKIFLHFLLVVLLTVVTQVGGLVYLVFLFFKSKFALNGLRAFALFLGIYIISILIVPFIAPLFGRVAMPIFGTLRPLNIMTCILNRHYVTPDLKHQMLEVTEQMKSKFPGTKVNYLDANFPFFNDFPLMPHLTHNDGKKVDIAFYYMDKITGKKTNSTPSFIGYGAFEGPKKGEIDYPEKCRSEGYIMYNMLKFLRPMIQEDEYIIDVERTSNLLKILAIDSRTSKIFIEPHLKARWNLKGYKKIRFQGCQAVRHDDHIHTQIF